MPPGPSESEPTQIHRYLSVETELGPDVILIRSFQGTDQMGRLFEYQLDVVSEQDVSLDALIGTNATVRLEMPNEFTKEGATVLQTRHFNGYISKITHSGYFRMGMSRYQVTMVPWLWFLTRTSDCRIFQHLTAPDILKTLFADAGFSDVEMRLTGDYREWDYLVQYRETDFNFASRLMEQEGIYYFFTHKNGKHVLVLADSMGAHDPYPGFEELIFRGNVSGDRTAYYVHSWTVGKEVKPGIYAHNDFNFKSPKPHPNTKMVVRADKIREHAASEFEIYDSPGEYEDVGQGESISEVRIEELQADHEVAHGETIARGMSPGFLFTLAEYPRDDQNRDYLITSTRFDIQSEDFVSGAMDRGQYFACSFSCIPAAERFRLPRVTPKPVVSGPQTAMVVGPPGEEIYVDEFGRVKVQFHWDRYGKYDPESSCWIRVSQGWAGMNWGSIFIPRIGQEVIVECLEGDPDRPIITGRVYNADCMPPYPLPDEKSKSTVKSLSYPGGGGFNEIRFEDKKGDEQIFVHAEKDYDKRTVEFSREFVGKDRHLIVDRDKYEKVTGDKFQIVDGERAERVGETISTKAEQDIQRKAGMNYGVEAGAQVHIKAGMTAVVEANSGITLKSGGSFITISPGQIAISAPMVLINSGGSALGGPGIAVTSPPHAHEADDALEGKVSENDPSPEKPLVLNASSPTEVAPCESCMKDAAGSGAPFVKLQR